MTVVGKEDRSSKAARQAHTWLVNSTDLYSNIIAHAGQYDSKIETGENASLAAHILNAVTVAVNSFVYEAFSPEDDIGDYEEEIRVLAAATALHDTNKYVREAHGFDADENTEAAFAVYFGEHDDVDNEGDDFGIEDDFLGSGYRDDLLYLVQRCEIGENSVKSRGTKTEFRGLERYCRIGDQVASIAQRDGVRGVSQKLGEKFGEDDVHHLTFSALEQPVLNDLLVGSTKQVVAGEDDGDVSGVMIGSTADTIVYLGKEIDRDNLESRVAELIPERVSEFGFSCKLNWNSFDYDILAEVAIPVEDKEEIITDAFRELLHDGTAGVEGFEHIPEEFDQYFPVLAKAIYLDGRDEFDDPDIQDTYDQIYDEQGGQKAKIHFIAHLIRNHERYSDFLNDLSEEVRPGLHDDLEPESDAIGTAVDRFFGGGDLHPLGSKSEMCFLCGEETDVKYQKGLSAVYRTQEYSRRVPPHAKYKSICEVCNLEYALFSDVCDRSDVSTNNAVEVAYFYFDEFLGDVRVRGRRSGSVIQDETIDIDDPEVTTSLVGPQYFLQPFYVLGDNHRMAVVRQVMRTAQQSGMKVVIGRPFTRFESADAVFADEEATRPQELLGLDEVERFGPLPDFVEGDRTDSHLRRALALFKIMSMVGQDAGMTNPYLQLDRDTFHSIADFAVVNHDNATRLSDLREYFQAYHKSEYMKMKTVAQRGIDLFGTSRYDSKYKKTKIFRETIDAILSGMSQGMESDHLIEYVEGQVYAAADREKWAGNVAPSDAEEFVKETRSYLAENDLDDMKKLSDWEDALVNSYYYACEQNFEEN